MENFKSQICTTKEQSERLLKLGLKKETADCYLFEYDKEKYKVIAESWLNLTADKEYHSQYKDVCFPAWSLHRLMEIAYNGDILGCVALNFHERNIGAYYEQVIKVIEYLIGVKEFNKDYLEEKL